MITHRSLCIMASLAVTITSNNSGFSNAFVVPRRVVHCPSSETSSCGKQQLMPPVSQQILTPTTDSSSSGIRRVNKEYKKHGGVQALALIPGNFCPTPLEHFQGNHAYYDLPWAIGFGITLILLAGVVKDECCGDVCDYECISKGNEEEKWACAKNVNGGFCVTSFDCDGTYVGPKDNPPLDSHTLAAYVDYALLVPAIGLPIAAYFGADIPDLFGLPYKGEKQPILQAISLIGGHGVLHGSLSKNYTAPLDSPDGIVPPGDEKPTISKTIGFLLLAYGITYFSFVGYSCLEDEKIKLLATFAVGSTVAGLSLFAGQDPISIFFISTQLLVTGVALFIPDHITADKVMGWTFAAACLVSLLEYYKCKSFLRDIGGHVWYDAMLHISVLSGYWVFDKDSNSILKFLGL